MGVPPKSSNTGARAARCLFARAPQQVYRRWVLC